MYCRKCGKEIDYDSPLCKECEEQEVFFSDATQVEPVEVKTEPEQIKAEPTLGSRKEGFSIALASTILGSIAYIFSMVALGIASAAVDELTYGYGYSSVAETIAGVAIFFSLICLGAAIPGLIMGIKSIRCFFTEKNEGRVKPIPTLILGIVGVAMSGLTMFFVLLTLAICSLI